MKTEEIQDGRIARVNEVDDLEGGDGRVALRTRIFGQQAVSTRRVGAQAVGALAVGAVAFGALAIGSVSNRPARRWPAVNRQITCPFA